MFCFDRATNIAHSELHNDASRTVNSALSDTTDKLSEYACYLGGLCYSSCKSRVAHLSLMWATAFTGDNFTRENRTAFVKLVYPYQV